MFNLTVTAMVSLLWLMYHTYRFAIYVPTFRPVTSLGHQVGKKFWVWPEFSEQCP